MTGAPQFVIAVDVRRRRRVKPTGATQPFFDRQYKHFLMMLDQQEALRET